MHDKSRKVVFIVDDDPDDRQFILDALLEVDKGFEYVAISSAEHLLAGLGSNGSKVPDLIILESQHAWCYGSTCT